MFILQTASVALQKSERSDVGVYVGVEPSGQASTQSEANVYSASGGSASITSGRLSYTKGLLGPCLSIDTACSSALSALHVARVAIIHGECVEALVAGTKALSETSNAATAVAGMTSWHGRCHSFDLRADGYCRGEGCVAFLLLNSDESMSEFAVTGSAVRQDGPSASLTAPNGSSQKRLLMAVGESTPAALEAHGTGTALGDPIEVGAAVGALCRDGN